MNFTVTIDAAQFEADLQHKLQGAVAFTENAMAEQLHDIVMSNFGPPPGMDRPDPWAPLSDRSAIGRAYIAKVNRRFATLFVTGAMANAVRTTPSTGEGARVSLSDADCPYATRHHWGTDHLPIRRVFPIEFDGSITEFSTNAVKEAAFMAFQEAMK